MPSMEQSLRKGKEKVGQHRWYAYTFIQTLIMLKQLREIPVKIPKSPTEFLISMPKQWMDQSIYRCFWTPVTYSIHSFKKRMKQERERKQIIVMQVMWIEISDDQGHRWGGGAQSVWTGRQKRLHRRRGAWTGSGASDERSITVSVSAVRNSESSAAKMDRLKVCPGDREPTCVAGAKGSGRKPWVGDGERQAGPRPWKNPLLQGRKAVWSKAYTVL